MAAGTRGKSDHTMNPERAFAEREARLAKRQKKSPPLFFYFLWAVGLVVILFYSYPRSVEFFEPSLAVETSNIENQTPELEVSAGDDGQVETVVVADASEAEVAKPRWQANAVAFDAVDATPRLVIVIDDLGNSFAASRRLRALPSPLTLSYLPHTMDIVAETTKARAAGHELLLHLPMAPKNTGLSPGPHALGLGMEQANFEAELRWNLAQFDGYIGVNNHMGSFLTEQRKEMAWLMTRLRDEGLIFLDSKTTSASVAFETAKAYGVPAVRRDIFIDNTRTVEAIIVRLNAAVRKAQLNGYAIVIGHPYSETLDALEAWLPTLESDAIALAPLSAVIPHS